MAASVDSLFVHSSVKGSGQTIIFVHGWTCDESSWDAQLPVLAKDYRVVSLDLPGHGKSEGPASVEGYSMRLFADAVEAVRAEIGADKVVLVGHSMGALVIRAYALKYPDRVAGLVAVDGRLDQREWTKIDNPEVQMTRELRESLIKRMFVEKTSSELTERIRAMMMSASSITAQGAYDAMSDPANQSDKIIDAPALTVWAAQSFPDPEFETRDMIPSWEEIRLEGTGHFLMMEQPNIFNEILAQFIVNRAQF
ncbi:alpha/beta fold hydrolase [Altererythrobacter sp. GH1-8]|uniref:alpha/beta fold hydrolase n=1 Tax=Altererythrobacter sp. GH1-8 TaxID=3349333 RepID=UPI00374DBBB9